MRRMPMRAIRALPTLIDTLMRLSALEGEITVELYNGYRQHNARRRRATSSPPISATRSSASSSARREEGDALRDQAVRTSASARGMLGKTSEVAAAAEQSAVAMREAAQTAAGLIRAIEDARTEVEAAAEIATRASARPAHAVGMSETLSRPRQVDRIDPRADPRHRRPDQSARAQRDDRGGARRRCRPRLRGGRAGGEEPRQPDRARDRRHRRQDRRDPVGDPLDGRDQRLDQATVAEVQERANRIRHAMEAQAQTVTAITAAVDETALAADSMSDTIAAIREDTETVASEIDTLEQRFRRGRRAARRSSRRRGEHVRGRGVSRSRRHSAARPSDFGEGMRTASRRARARRHDHISSSPAPAAASARRSRDALDASRRHA